MSEPEWVPIHAVLDEHIPSLTDEDDQDIHDLANDYVFGTNEVGIADLAIRTCKCGKAIDGFYEYVTHLKEVTYELWK